MYHLCLAPSLHLSSVVRCFPPCSLFKSAPTCSLPPSPHPNPHFSPISSPPCLVRGGGHTPRWNNSRRLYSHAPPRNLCPQVWNSITQPQTGGSTQIHLGGRQQRHQILSEIRPPALREEKRRWHDGVVKGGCGGLKKYIPVLFEEQEP